MNDYLQQIDLPQTVGGDMAKINVGRQLKIGDNLWSRAKKGELFAKAMEEAENTASGFENGLRIEFNKILKSKKQSKYFNNAEKAVMRDLVKGDTAQNFAKLIGKFGVSEGRATNVLMGLLGGGAGAAIGGIGGAFVVPTIGQVGKVIAQKLTRNKADFTAALARAGNRGEDITKAYMVTVPKAKRNVADLSQLLSDPTVNLEKIITSSNKMIKEAAEIAAGRQVIGEVLGLGASGFASGERVEN